MRIGSEKAASIGAGLRARRPRHAAAACA